jgi:hypothetical protein
MTLIVGIVHWKIKIECRDDFVKFWKEKFTIEDKAVLFGEFLSELTPEMRHTLATWNICCGSSADDYYGRCAHFINIGFWRSIRDFDEQTNKYKSDENPIKDFETGTPPSLFCRANCPSRGRT